MNAIVTGSQSDVVVRSLPVQRRWRWILEQTESLPVVEWTADDIYSLDLSNIKISSSERNLRSIELVTFLNKLGLTGRLVVRETSSGHGQQVPCLTMFGIFYAGDEMYDAMEHILRRVNNLMLHKAAASLRELAVV